MREEIARIDFSGLLARGAERVSRATSKRPPGPWPAGIGEQLTPATAAELLAPRPARARARAGGARCWPPTLRVARRQGWDQRILDGGVLGAGRGDGAPGVPARGRRGDRRSAARYRERLGVYPRLFMGLATMLGVLDRDRLGGRAPRRPAGGGEDRDHPLRAQGTEVLADLERRLGDDPALAARSRGGQGRARCRRRRWRRWWMTGRRGADRARCCADLAGEAVRSWRAWLAERLDRARVALAADASRAPRSTPGPGRA